MLMIDLIDSETALLFDGDWRMTATRGPRSKFPGDWTLIAANTKTHLALMRAVNNGSMLSRYARFVALVHELCGALRIDIPRMIPVPESGVIVQHEPINTQKLGEATEAFVEFEKGSR